MKSKEPTAQFGVTSMGEKGQVVIPADIRAQLRLEKGEKLIVMYKHGNVTLIPASHFEEMAKRFSALSDAFNSAKEA